MRTLIRNAVLSAAIAATTLAAMPAANAGERWHGHGPRTDHVVRKDNTGAIVAAGVLGLAVGALIANANQPAAHRQPVVHPNPYLQPRPRPERDYFPPRPVQHGHYGYHDGHGRHDHYRPVRNTWSAEPWTPEWYRYCSSRYRSFDARTGTYRGYDGRSHFCVAE